MPSVGFTELPGASGKPAYGQPLREWIRNDFGSRLGLFSAGAMIPNQGCYCELDANVKDRWGIPVLRFHWKVGTQETEQAQHAVRAMSEMISAMGGKSTISKSPDGSYLWGAGEASHEVGTARMGSTPADSVLNSYSQAWDVRNLYVADGACFAGHAGKNPTETIMALAWRASDHLADSLVRKEI
jgi:choline dehydrogenase-like flavoprotein